MTGAHNDLRHDLIVVVIPGLAANLSTAEIGFDHSPYVVSSLDRFKLLGFERVLRMNQPIVKLKHRPNSESMKYPKPSISSVRDAG